MQHEGGNPMIEMLMTNLPTLLCMLLGMGLIIAGVVVINLFSKSVSH